MVMMILAGIWAIRMMPSQLDPPMHFPMVFVEVSWIGASAEDLETLVTTPIEQQLRTLTELNEINSITRNGYTFINVRFDYDADIAHAMDQVKQRVANIRNLPPEIEPPVVRRPVDLEPVASLLFSGAEDVSELIPLLRRYEKDLLARGFDAITYDGLPMEEIALQVGGRQLQAMGLTLEELAGEVSRVSQDNPAGTIGSGQGSRQLRSLDQRRDLNAFAQLHIRSGEQVIRLGDIAEIVQRPQRGQPLITREGKPAIEMTVHRATEADAFRAHEILDAWLQDTRASLPSGVEMLVLNDVWELLGAQLSMILKNGLSGLVLVIGILYLFLSGRVGWWVTLGIPVSFMLALAFFHLGFGYGISIIALIGFIMAIGIVVDDAIVVAEDTVTHFEEGKSPLDAAVAGAQRMWVPVLTSSMTTMAAFIPLLIMGGEMGDVIMALPTVLLCVIVASLVECFLVLPGHLSGSLGRLKRPAADSWRARFDRAFFGFRDRRFMPFVNRALDYPGATLCAAIGGVVIALSLLLSQHVGFAFVTGFDIESLQADVEFSSAATETDKIEFLKHVETELAAVNESSPNLLGWVTKHNLAWFGQERMTGEQYASITASYRYEETRTLSPAAFLDQWRQRIVKPAFVEQLTVQVAGGANNGEADLSLVLRGEDLDALKRGAEELAEALSRYPGVSNVIDNLPYGREQVIFEITPQGRSLGLTSDSIGRQLRAAYSGARVQIFNDRDSELEVRMMLPDVERNDLARLQQFPVRTAEGIFVPLSSVAVLYNRRGIDVIRHTDGQMAVTVEADVDPQQGNAIAITGELRRNALPEILDRYNLSFGLGGKSEQDEVIMDTMALGGLLTLLLIYLILTWVFASYLWPLAIMMAIPFGFTGAVFGHWVTGWDVGAMTLLAFFSLTGIVVNDSIVLISFFKRSIEAGASVRSAMDQAVRARFRAVLLTSLTTIAGLLPLMFETSSLAFYVAPIAVTLCFGLAFATLLVLIVIPALIVLLESGRDRFQSLGGHLQRHWFQTDSGSSPVATGNTRLQGDS
ncbi:MAG: efflux RND transporter permease subunit [Pseudomonadales bacterium]|nr:efflux RND transporter permease subunit [Pseudomonadales bacterium]